MKYLTFYNNLVHAKEVVVYILRIIEFAVWI